MDKGGVGNPRLVLQRLQRRMEAKRKRGRGKAPTAKAVEGQTGAPSPSEGPPMEEAEAGASSPRRLRGRPRKPVAEAEGQLPAGEGQNEGRDGGRRQKARRGESAKRPSSPLRNSLVVVNSGGESGDQLVVAEQQSLRWEQVARVVPSMDAVVKVFCVHTEPNFSLPWQRKRQYSSSSSGFIIGDRRVLTNAHSVEHHTQVKLKKRGSDTKYLATVLAIGTECDIGTFTPISLSGRQVFVLLSICSLSGSSVHVPSIFIAAYSFAIVLIVSLTV